MWPCMCTASVKLTSRYCSKTFTSSELKLFQEQERVMSSCWAEAICSGRFKEVLETQDETDPLECGFCSASFAQQGLHCSGCPRVKKGKNEVLKSRFFSWGMVVLEIGYCYF